MYNTLAIDFGTMRTKAAYFDPKQKKVELMRLGQDDRPYIPSLFYLSNDGQHLFGDTAADHLHDDPQAFLVDPLKRKLREQSVRAGNRVKATPTALLAMLFAGLKERTKEVPCFRNKAPEVLRLTVPAQYGPPDKEVLQNAAITAGFTEVQFVDEPVAAAKAWISELEGSEDYVVVLDCGGGTLDWACLHRQSDGEFELIPELPPGGDNKIGGVDIDKELCAWIEDQLDDDMRSGFETKRCSIQEEVRRQKEKHSRMGSGGMVRIGDKEIILPAEIIEDVIAKRFIGQACQNFREYLDKVRSRLKIDTPTVLLVGGSARLAGFKETIAEQCKCKVVWWERSEFATVLGALAIETESAPVNNPPPSASPKHKSEDTRAEPSPSKTSEASVNQSLAQAQYEEAATAFQSGNADVAIQKLTLCVMLAPSHQDARELLVHAFAAKEDLVSATMSAKAWADAFPQNQRAWCLLGTVAFAGGDFATSAMVLGRVSDSLGVEELLTLAASLCRQEKVQETLDVLERLNKLDLDRAAFIVCLFMRAWLGRGTGYGEEALQDYNQALVAWRTLTSDEQARVISLLAWFDIGLSNFELTTEMEMFCALLNLHGGDIRASMELLFELCGGKIENDLVWCSQSPEPTGLALASTLCSNGMNKEAVELVSIMCAKLPTFDVKLVQDDECFQDARRNHVVQPLFEPNLTVTENHGALFNDVTVTNHSFYRVTNVKVKIQVVRESGKSDTPFTLSFPEIPAGTTQSQNGVFKNAGWFGGDVKRVETVVVACDQQFKHSRVVAEREQAPRRSNRNCGTSPTGDEAAPVAPSASVRKPGTSWTAPSGIEFVWVPPGSFMMGSPGSEPDHCNDETQHRVTLTKGYWLGKYEVIQGQWQAVMWSNPSYFKGADLPVENVSWENCQEFIRKLCAKEGVAEGTYRLPTEAEWEYACRAGSTGPHAGHLFEMGWCENDSGGKTHAVGTNTPNAFGLYDMYGNVWEWCSDLYGDYPTGSVTDPAGPSSGSARVSRGGSWSDSARVCRSAYRCWFIPSFRSNNLGFRLLRTE